MKYRIITAYARLKQTPGGARWQLVIEYTTPYDEPGTKYKRTTKNLDRSKVTTKEQAERQLKRFRDETARKLAEMPEPKHTALDASTTVPEYVERVTKQREAAEKHEQSTRYSHGFALNHIREGFKGVTLGELKASDVTAWIAGMNERGLSPATIAKSYRLLRAALDVAVDDETIPNNPAAKRSVKLPKAGKEQPNVLDAAGRLAIIDELEKLERTPPVLAAYIALYTGMRRGEICGITWADVDLNAATIAVNKTVAIQQGGTYIKAPKTERGRRVVPMPSQLVPILAAHRLAMYEEWAALMERAGVEPSAAHFSALYVIGLLDGRYYNPTLLGKEWNAIAKNHKLKGTQGRVITLHDLRHTYATVAVAGRADVKSVSGNLGHATTAVTLDVYAADDEEAQRQTAETVGAAYERGKESGND